MKALILAAGYATRLYPLTKDTPKPLLEVGGKAIIDHILDKIEDSNVVDQVYVVTNDRFYNHFQEWAKGKANLKIINDGTQTNEDRLGAIGDIHYVLLQESVDDDLLVIAGDNLFGFSLHNFINSFEEKSRTVVALCDLKDLEKVKGKYGVGILEGSRVIDFEEKPLEPRSSLAATACYIFSKEDLNHVKDLAENGKADAPGNIISYLAEKSEVHGFVFDEHWYDVGSHESLKEAREAYED